MNNIEIWNAINDELRKDKKAYPTWPDHIVARAAIVAEEAGELLQASLQYKYEKGKNGRTLDEQKKMMQDEAVQTAVTAIRFLELLK